MIWDLRVMAHFSLLVIGTDVDAQMRPFHQYESTGYNDEHVSEFDRTKEFKEDYENFTIEGIDLPDGTLLDCYDRCIYRDPFPEETIRTSDGFSTITQDWEDGRGIRMLVKGNRVQVPCRHLLSFEEYLKEYAGIPVIENINDRDKMSSKYAIKDENGDIKVFRLTNPNFEWDYWKIGGRWEGFFPLKPNARNQQTSSTSLKRDIDFEKARYDAELEAHNLFDLWGSLMRTYGKPSTWEEIKHQKGDTQEALSEYWSQPAIHNMRAKSEWLVTDPVSSIGFDRKLFVEQQRMSILEPYAYLYHGEWVMKSRSSEMSSRKRSREWSKKVSQLYNDVPSDTQLTIVDCHI